MTAPGFAPRVDAVRVRLATSTPRASGKEGSMNQILERLRNLDGMEQVIVCNGVEFVTTLRCSSERMALDLEAFDSMGVRTSFDEDGDRVDFNNAEFDEILDVIEERFPSANIEVDWHNPTKGNVHVTLTSRTIPRDGDEGGIAYELSTKRSGLSICERGHWSYGHDLAVFVDAAKNKTAMTERWNDPDEELETRARVALKELLVILGGIDG